jgi:hypothetical protein
MGMERLFSSRSFSCSVLSHFHVILLCNLNDLLEKLSRIVCQKVLYLVDVNTRYCYPFFLALSNLNVEVCISFCVFQIIVLNWKGFGILDSWSMNVLLKCLNLQCFVVCPESWLLSDLCQNPSLLWFVATR